MRLGLWAIFGGSLFMLTLLLFRNRHSMQVLSKIAMIGVCSVLLLYVFNWVGGVYSFHLPINGITVTAVGFLGLPGLALLMAVQAFLL